MASELSRFIEDELKRQGINDDEEQRLLIRSRVKPLAVQSAGQSAAGTWINKQRVILGACLLIAFLGLVLLVTSVRSNRTSGVSWRGAITEPEAGVLPVGEQKSPAAASPTQHDTQPVHEKEVEGPEGDEGGDIDEYPPGEQQGEQQDAAAGAQQGGEQEQPQPSPSPSPPAAASPEQPAPAAASPEEPAPAAASPEEPAPAAASPEQPSSPEAVPAPAAGGTSPPAASTAPVAPSPVPSPAPAAANATGAASPPAEAAPGEQLAAEGEASPSEQPPAPMEGNSEGDSSAQPQGGAAPEGAAPAPVNTGNRRLLQQRQL